MKKSTTPNWDAFLNNIFEGDQVLIAKVQRIFGQGVRRQDGEDRQ